jgi:Zn-dependent membrane protease YugP
MYYPIWYDSTFLIFIVPTLILGLIAQAMVKSRFNKYSQVRTLRGLTGAQAAREILDSNGLGDVTIEKRAARAIITTRAAGHYGSHPRWPVLRRWPP